MSLLDCQDQGFKGALHGATGTLCVLMGAYNLLVWRSARGARWHLGSALTYGAIAALECVQVARHCPAGKEQRP